MTERRMSMLYCVDSPGHHIDIDPTDDPRTVRISTNQHPDTTGIVVATQLIEATAQAAGLDNVGPFLDLHGVAARVGLAYDTVKSMRSRNKDFPVHDHRFGKVHVWRPSTIDRWRPPTKEETP